MKRTRCLGLFRLSLLLWRSRHYSGLVLLIFVSWWFFQDVFKPDVRKSEDFELVHKSVKKKTWWHGHCSAAMAKVQANDKKAKPPTKKKTSLVFIKTHKTGSSTIQNILMRFGDRQNLTFVLPRTSDIFNLNDILEEELLERDELSPSLSPNDVLVAVTEKLKADIFCLHSWLFNPDEVRKFVKEDAIWVTILRDPRTQFASLYSYYNFDSPLYMNATLDEFLDSPVNMWPDLLTTWAFTSKVPNQMLVDLGMRPENLGDAMALEYHLKMIEDSFHHVMIMERMDESLVLLRHLMNWDLEDLVYLKHNQAIDASTVTDVYRMGTSKIEKLDVLLSPDHTLYNRFNQMLSARISEFGTKRMQDEIAALRCLRKAAKGVCKIHPFQGYDLPERFRPYSPKSYGIMPLISSEGSGDVTTELVDMCEKMCYSEPYFLDHLREKQGLWADVKQKAKKRLATPFKLL